MPTINDYKKSSLTRFGYTGSISDAEYKWLRAQVSPYKGAIPDMWNKYLYNRGFTTGPLPHRLARYLQSLGYTGSLPNMLYQFWKNGASPAWAANTDLWWDATDNALINGASPFSITGTHAQTIYGPNAAGVYLPFAVNELVRTDLGLQTVPTRTNTAIQAYDGASAEWTSNQSSYIAGQAGPSGLNSNNAILLTAQTGAGGSFISSNVVTGTNYVSGTTYTISRFVKADTQSLVQMTGPSAAFGAGQYANFDLTGAGTAAPTGCTAAIEALANGWYRIAITVVATATISATSGVVVFITSMAATRIPVNGTLTTRFYVIGAQVEAGAFASPPILTTTTAVTVNGNQQVISGLGTQLAVGVAGVIQVNLLNTYASVANRLFEFNDGTSNEEMCLFMASASTYTLEMRSGGVGQGTVTVAAPTMPAVQTLAFAFGSNYFNARVVGQAASSPDTSGTYAVTTALCLMGNGLDLTRNCYARTSKLALKFGPQDASTFAAMYDRAVLAAAA